MKVSLEWLKWVVSYFCMMGVLWWYFIIIFCIVVVCNFVTQSIDRRRLRRKSKCQCEFSVSAGVTLTVSTTVIRAMCKYQLRLSIRKMVLPHPLLAHQLVLYLDHHHNETPTRFRLHYFLFPIPIINNP